MSDLMELVDMCPQVLPSSKKDASYSEKLKELEALGFNSIALRYRSECAVRDKAKELTGYTIITDQMIEHFLCARLTENWATETCGGMNALHLMKSKPPKIKIERSHGLEDFERAAEYKAQGWSRDWRDIVQAQWSNSFIAFTERPIQYVVDIPPQHAIDRLKAEKERGIFDYYTIAKVETSTTSMIVKDPLLLGRFHGKHDRYFLAQWGDDVALDDLI